MSTKIPRSISGALAACAVLAAANSAQANGWVSPGPGYWSDPANWAPAAVPDNTGGWAIAEVTNGVAVVNSVVPSVSEAWAGNSGMAGTIIVTNGGTLPVSNWLVVGRTGNGGMTPMSTLVVGEGGIVNKTGDGFILGDGTYCTGAVYVVGNGQINITGGWNGIGNGEGGVGYLYLQDNARYTLGGQDWNVGDYGSGRGFAYIKDNATLTVSRFFVGKNDSSFGVLVQSGGAIVGEGNNANEWTIGGDNDTAQNVYGYYELSAGTFNNPNNFQIGRRGIGLLYQSGGTLTQGSWCAVGRYSGAVGILHVSGGEFNHTGTGQSLMIAEGGSRGEATVAGTGTISTAREMAIGNGGNGTLNLNTGGTLHTPRVNKWGGSGILNFNGGTLKAKAIEANFISNLDAARVYKNGAIIDTAGFDVTIPQPLVGVYGNGVLSIPVTDGGVGYSAPPTVTIEGDGMGAQAIAKVDAASGKVTSIEVTCPGFGYSTIYSVTIMGGGAAISATAGTPTLGDVSGGGLVKNGAGTLTLTGANEYTGPTVVNAGTVVMNTSATGGGALTVADGAELDVQVHTAGGLLYVNGLTLGTTTGGTTVNVDLGAYGNPVMAPINIAGPLNVKGQVMLNVATDYPQTGVVPLIQYASRTGTGSFVLGPMRPGVVANLVTNVSGQTIDLVITSVAAPRWDGQAGGTWDLVTQNWVDLGSGLPTLYDNGLVALLDDAALGTTMVQLNQTVTPAAVVVNNTNLAYTIYGTGSIAGSATVTKSGSNVLNLLTVNDYTGPTIINGGTIAVTNLANGGQASAIGKSSSDPSNLVLAGGTLSYSGPAKTVDRGYLVKAGGSGISAQSDLTISGNVAADANSGFVKSGPATLKYVGTGTNQLSGGAFPGYNVTSGSVLFDGSAGAQANQNRNEFWVSSVPDVPATLVLSNTSLYVESWLALGRGNGSSDILSSLTAYDSKINTGNFSAGYDNNLPGNLARQTISLNGNTVWTNRSDMNVGESAGSTATFLMNGDSLLFSDSRIFFGWHTGGRANVTVADNATMIIDAWFSIAHEGGAADVTFKDNAKLWVLGDFNVTDVGLGEGVFNLQGNATARANNLWVGKGVGSTGTFNQSGGSLVGLTSGNEMHIGFHGLGTYNMTGGNIIAPNHWFIVGRWSDGPGTLNVSAGSIIHGTNNTGRYFRVGEDGQGVLNLSGTGLIESHANEVTVGWNATGDGTVNLNGGTFQARRIIGGTGFATFNFNGGVLRAGPNAATEFMANFDIVNVQSGAIIDTGTNTVAINADLLASGSGGLTKQGSGTLALNGNNSYTGTTAVNAGYLGGNGVIASAVNVQAAGGVSPGVNGIGTLTINNTLNLAGTTVMQIDAAAGTNDQVLGVTTLTYGGTLVLTNIGGAPAVGTVYKLFTAGTYAGSFTSVVSGGVTYDTSKLAVDGTVKVLSSIAEEPVELEVTASGAQGLTVTWPASHTGWVLQVQTNSATVGLSTNWHTLPGSTSVNTMTFPVDPTKSFFMRLVRP